MSTPPRKNSTSARLWKSLGIALACILGVTVALVISNLSHSSPRQVEPSVTGAYHRPSAHRESRALSSQPGREANATGPATQATGVSSVTSSSGIAPGDKPLSPELEERLRTLTNVATQPAHSGGPLPPSEPLSPALELARREALTGWQAQVQRLLDRCVARPETLRQPASLDVMFAPASTDNGLAVQQLSPVAVTLPAPELRRLWQDTDPDALQACLDQVRAQALSVPAPPKTPARVLPVARETLRVAL
jgi:hypothetical protein